MNTHIHLRDPYYKKGLLCVINTTFHNQPQSCEGTAALSDLLLCIYTCIYRPCVCMYVYRNVLIPFVFASVGQLSSQ